MNPTETNPSNSQTPSENINPNVQPAGEVPAPPPQTIPTAVNPTPTTNPSLPSTPTPSVTEAPSVASATPSVVSVTVDPESQPPANVPMSTNPTGGAIISGGDTPPTVRKGLSKKSKLIAAGTALLGVLLIGSGYVFGFYIPSRPNNIWKTSLTRSGKAVDSLIKTATDPKVIEQFKNSQLDGTLEFNSKDYNYSGNFTAKLNTSKADATITFSSKSPNQAEQKLILNILGELPDQSRFPNIYFQLTGLKSLGLGDLSPGILAYDGKWIDVEASYLNSIAPASTSQTPVKDRIITSDDVAQLAKAVSTTSTQYLFTADPKKAVFVEKSFVKREKVDGIDAYHYTAGLDKAHLKDYCRALSDVLYSSKVYKKFTDADQKSIDDAKLAAQKDCDSSVDDSLKTDPTFDLWVDAKYKLIYKVRVYDDKNKATYVDIGQNYKGGDSLSLFINSHDDPGKVDAKFTLDTNLKTNNTKATFTYDNTSADAYNIKVTFAAKPFSGDVTVKKPDGAILIQDVLKQLGIDPNPSSSDISPGTSSSTTNAKDAERQADVKAIQSHLESYYAQNGYYPQLDLLNSDSWRATNMKGLDKEAFKDPDGSSYALVPTATTKQYGYSNTGCNSKKECTSYKLSAMLSTGALYSKDALN